MAFYLDYKGNKSFRLLNMFERLNKGELLNKSSLANSFGVTLKTVQRDIEDLRSYLVENHGYDFDASIKYDKVQNVYYLVKMERDWLTNEEVLVLCKILLESRAFNLTELNILLDKLLAQVAPANKLAIEDIIREEKHHYVPLKHEKNLFTPIWRLSQFISKHEVITFDYVRQDGNKTNPKVKPVAIMFSEYYFYLIAYSTSENRKYPITYRIDRISEIEGTKDKFTVPYSEQFNDGEFRKRVQFMYSGELKKFEFKFSGPSLEAILDRLPTAEVKTQEGNVSTIQVECYGDGVLMWLKSQGDWVTILENENE